MDKVSSPFGRFSFRPRIVLAGVVLIALGMIPAGCHREAERPGAYTASSTSDCLPDITLTDQYGKKVSLSSLKGKPVLFDFIYTTCPVPCLMLTSRMRLVANRIGAMLGNKVTFVVRDRPTAPAIARGPL